MAVRATLLLLTGAVLGVLSRIEEVTAGLSAGVSSDSTWVAAASLPLAAVLVLEGADVLTGAPAAGRSASWPGSCSRRRPPAPRGPGWRRSSRSLCSSASARQAPGASCPEVSDNYSS